MEQKRDPIRDLYVLKEAMTVFSVSFKYRKADGTIREARGTTSVPFLREKGALPKGESEVKQSTEVLRYYDLDKDGWRSCRVDSIIWEE